jgi:hypothetical protein
MRTCACNLPDKLGKYQDEHAGREENVIGNGMPIGKMRRLSDDVSEQVLAVARHGELSVLKRKDFLV